MNEFIKTLLSLSFSGTLLMLLILGLKQLYNNKFSRCWQYYIWLNVVLRFVLPFTPNTTLVGNLFERFDTAVIQENSAYQNLPVLADYSNVVVGEAQAGRVNDTAASDNSIDIYTYIFFVWAALALVLFIRKIAIYQGFINYAKAGNTEVSNIEILNLLSDCEEKLNIRKPVELYQNALIVSPMMTGFFSSSIILPDREIPYEELSYVFTHELIHYKRKDMFYKWLVQISICVHWFNPFVYFLEKEINKDCELSCDEKVIFSLDDKSKRKYGDTLLSFIKAGNTYRNSPASVTLTEGTEQLKERLGAIMNFKKKSKIVFAMSIITAFFIAISSVAIGAYAAPSAGSNHAAFSTEYTVEWGNIEWENVEWEDGVCYIYCNGADESDKPTGGVTEGSIGFVLVRKDSYTSMSGFSNLETLLNDVAEQCDLSLEKGWITAEEKSLLVEVAATIVSLPRDSDLGASVNDYDILTYRLSIENAPDEVRAWIHQCDITANGIYVTEYNDRYWIYTNAVGSNKDYRFEISSDNAGVATVTISPTGTSGDGYALLSVPARYVHLFAQCGDYTVEISR